MPTEAWCQRIDRLLSRTFQNKNSRTGLFHPNRSVPVKLRTLPLVNGLVEGKMYRRNITGFSHQILSICSFSFFFWGFPVQLQWWVSTSCTASCTHLSIRIYIYIYYVCVCVWVTTISLGLATVAIQWNASGPSPFPGLGPPLEARSGASRTCFHHTSWWQSWRSSCLRRRRPAVSKQFVWSLQPMFYVFFFFYGISCTWYVWYLLLRAVVFVGATLSPTFPWSPGPTVFIFNFPGILEGHSWEIQRTSLGFGACLTNDHHR